MHRDKHGKDLRARVYAGTPTQPIHWPHLPE